MGIRGVGYMKAVGDRPVRVSVSSSGGGGIGGSGRGGGDDGDDGGDDGVVAVDGDVELLRSHFGMTHLDRADMSPSSSVLSSSAAASSGGGRDDYARGYLDGDVGHDGLLEGVRRAYGNLTRCTAATTTGGTTRTIDDDDDDDVDVDDESVIIVEGTGHAGAGSVIGAGNACIAAGLGASVILVADGGGGEGGGMGEAFDELHANRSLFLVSR